ncbi:hypothetical protein AB1Y20_017314 [Prymnesium parvum]|uniref:Uncharacterized protein n=1 Tax=Prymnesium parvum TaxID=97485 RepID=A0AB34JNN0_PRYPA
MAPGVATGRAAGGARRTPGGAARPSRAPAAPPHADARFAPLARRLESYDRAEGRIRPRGARFLHPLSLHGGGAAHARILAAPLRVWDEEAVRPRVGCSLSRLGVGNAALLAFGGHGADGKLAEGGALVCDAVAQRWHPLPRRDEPERHAPCPRSDHSAAVMGENRSLLIVCGGEGEHGELLGDIAVLQMRCANSRTSADRRRRERTTRERAYDELCSLREHAAELRRQLLHATAAAKQASAMLSSGVDDGTLGSASVGFRAKLDELQSEVERLREEESSVTRELHALFKVLEEQLESLKCEWEWIAVDVVPPEPEEPQRPSRSPSPLRHASSSRATVESAASSTFLTATEATHDVIADATARVDKAELEEAKSASSRLRARPARGEQPEAVSFVPRRRHACVAIDNCLWVFGGEVWVSKDGETPVGGDRSRWLQQQREQMVERLSLSRDVREAEEAMARERTEADANELDEDGFPKRWWWRKTKYLNPRASGEAGSSHGARKGDQSKQKSISLAEIGASGRKGNAAEAHFRLGASGAREGVCTSPEASYRMEGDADPREAPRKSIMWKQEQEQNGSVNGSDGAAARRQQSRRQSTLVRYGISGVQEHRELLLQQKRELKRMLIALAEINSRPVAEHGSASAPPAAAPEAAPSAADDAEPPPADDTSWQSMRPPPLLQPSSSLLSLTISPAQRLSLRQMESEEWLNATGSPELQQSSSSRRVVVEEPQDEDEGDLRKSLQRVASRKKQLASQRRGSCKDVAFSLPKIDPSMCSSASAPVLPKRMVFSQSSTSTLPPLGGCDEESQASPPASDERTLPQGEADSDYSSEGHEEPAEGTQPQAPREGKLLVLSELICATFLRSPDSTSSAPHSSCGEHTSAAALKVRWVRVKAHGRAPSARAGHAMCTVRGQLLLHGGMGYREEPSYPTEQFCFLSNNILPSRLTGRRVLFSDIHLFDLPTCRWSQPELACGGPSRRAFHSMASLDGRVLVFGGRGGNRGRFAHGMAVLELTPRTELKGDGFWTFPAIAEHAAQLPRAHAGAAAVNGRLMLFGGVDATGTPCSDLLLVDAGACALLSITPFSVPVTGGPLLTLHGRAFPTHWSASVRLRWRDAYDRGPKAPLEEIILPAQIRDDKARAFLITPSSHLAVHGLARCGRLSSWRFAPPAPCSPLVITRDRSLQEVECNMPDISDSIVEGELHVELLFSCNHTDGTTQTRVCGPIDFTVVGLTHPTCCELRGAGAKVAVAGLRASFVVVACDKLGRKRRAGSDNITLKLYRYDEDSAGKPQAGSRKRVPPRAFAGQPAKGQPEASSKMYEQDCLRLISLTDYHSGRCPLGASDLAAQLKLTGEPELIHLEVEEGEEEIKLPMNLVVAGTYSLFVQMRGQQVGDGPVHQFVIHPAETSPPDCPIFEREGEKGLCLFASPSRQYLLPTRDGFTFTMQERACDRYGNYRTTGGDVVDVELVRAAVVPKKERLSDLLRRAMRMHGIGDGWQKNILDVGGGAHKPRVVDHGDGTYQIQIDSLLTKVDAKPAVTWTIDDQPGQLSEDKWQDKLVRKAGFGRNNGLAIVREVGPTELTVQWIADSSISQGTPFELFGDTGRGETIVSNYLEGEVETEIMDRITILRLEASDTSEAMQYVIDDGEHIFHMPVDIVLSSVEARRKYLDSEPPPLLRGKWDCVITVNGELAHTETLNIIVPIKSSTKKRRGPRQITEWREQWDDAWYKCQRSLRVKGVSTHLGLHAYLLPHAQVFVKIFNKLAHPPGDDIFLYDWWVFCKRCKLPTYSPDENVILPQCAIDALLPPLPSNDVGLRFAPDRLISLSVFIESILKIAFCRYAEEPQLFAVERTVEDHILAFGIHSDTDEFRLLLMEKACRNVLNEAMRTLQAAYNKWANNDSKPTKLLTCKEAVEMIQELGLIGAGVTIRQCRTSLMCTLFDPPPRFNSAMDETVHLVFVRC